MTSLLRMPKRAPRAVTMSTRSSLKWVDWNKYRGLYSYSGKWPTVIHERVIGRPIVHLLGSTSPACWPQTLCHRSRILYYRCALLVTFSLGLQNPAWEGSDGDVQSDPRTVPN